jgi:hypothetical protein
MAVFWDVVPSSLVDTDRRFTASYCIHYQALLKEYNFKVKIWTHIEGQVILYLYE